MRIRNRYIVFAVLLLCGLAEWSWGSCPLLAHQDADEQREFQNVCQQISNKSGVSNGSNACTGCVGEYISQDWTNVNLPASGQWGDATSINLTAGDWDVTMIWAVNTLATATDFRCGIGLNSGNNSGGLVYGDNYLEWGVTSGNIITFGPLTIANYRMSLTSNTTVYAKQESAWSVQPASSGRISARRIR